jgi:hypothetical protein
VVTAVWILLAAITLLVMIFTGRTVVSQFGRASHAFLAEPKPHVAGPLLSVGVKRQIEETETEIRMKTERVAEIIAEKEGSPPKRKTEVSKDPLNETSFMRAISAKVEKVKRISGA